MPKLFEMIDRLAKTFHFASDIRTFSAQSPRARRRARSRLREPAFRYLFGRARSLGRVEDKNISPVVSTFSGSVAARGKKVRAKLPVFHSPLISSFITFLGAADFATFFAREYFYSAEHFVTRRLGVILPVKTSLNLSTRASRLREPAIRFLSTLPVVLYFRSDFALQVQQNALGRARSSGRVGRKHFASHSDFSCRNCSK